MLWSFRVIPVNTLSGGATTAAAVRPAITQYVDREEMREAFRQDSLKAWESFRATGLHVSADEADAWMAQLEHGQDVEPPECHD